MDRAPQERRGPLEPAPDPGGAETGRHVEGAGLCGVRTGIALDERHPRRDAQLRRARPRGGEEHLAEVHARARRAEPLGPPAQQLALAAREIEDARLGLDVGELTDAAAASPR